MSQEPKKTPLYHMHRAANGRLVDFAGWTLPVQYSGITQEHRVVRSTSGLFDVSHMGQFWCAGSGALPFLQRLLPRDCGRLQIGRGGYALMLNQAGGAIDDLAVFRTGPERYLLVVNAARRAVDWKWVDKVGRDFTDLDLQDASDETAMLALQGPQAEAVLQALGSNLAQVPYFGIVSTRLADISVVACRSGYTGEDGFELLCAPDEAASLWQALLSVGAQPCGLGARDTLRTEMGYSLYGHELDETTSPLEAGLGWTVHWQGNFIGRTALEKQRQVGLQRRLVGFQMEMKSLPRPDYTVCNALGEKIGQVTSGTFSPSLEKGIGLAYVKPDWRAQGTPLQIEIRGRMQAAQVARPPFVTSNVKR
ncbi:MAG: glycine cleavage system aminomethyltransferase GcvT [Candidatus Latescibacteria bacterium]|nr:glycine cleavage system aminomethyltransferase GcvT [Candidatus Latescibacterota bacterium]